MRTAVIALSVAALAITPRAQQGIQGSEPVPPAAYKKLVADFTAENAKVRAAVKALTESEDYKKAVEEKDREVMNKLRAGLPKVDRAAYAARALAEAEIAQGNDRARFLTWTLESGAPPEAAGKAIDQLIESHLDSPVFAEFCATANFVYGIGRADPEKTSARLQAIRAGTKNPEVKAWALYAEAMGIRGKDLTEEQQKKRDELLAQAEKLAAGTDLADRIAAPRFEAERLQVGMEVPDIIGEDLDGVKFKLSDYRGKVVVLDFWGDW